VFFLLYTVLISHDDVMRELEAETVATSAGLGLNGERFNPGPVMQAAFVEIRVSGLLIFFCIIWHSYVVIM